jgi:hypothetical protein
MTHCALTDLRLLLVPHAPCFFPLNALRPALFGFVSLLISDL